MDSVCKLVSIVLLLCSFTGTGTAYTDSCFERCDDAQTTTYDCQCSGSCISLGNCCSDYNQYCDTSATCNGRDCYGNNNAFPCNCNSVCSQYNDCCPDYIDVCVGTCDGKCDDGYDASLLCQCNSDCVQYDNCCSDYDNFCTSGTSGTCEGKCDDGYDASLPCQCNSACAQYDNCCSDYDNFCTSGTSCTATSVSDSELDTISENLWDLDTNSAKESDIIVNKQSQTTQGSMTDVAPDPFFTYVNEAVLYQENFQLLQALQDNYIREQGTTEVVTDGERQEQSNFLDYFLATPIGLKLYDFLSSKKLAGCDGTTGFKTLLSNIWFGLYSRQTTDDTSGFEHSFVGEIKGSGVSGFHNWVEFYKQEYAGELNYLGYLSVSQPRLYGMTFTWYGADKPINGITIGTSPEIEFAMYTLCHLARPNSVCNILVMDSSKTVYPASIQTYTWTKSTPAPGQYYVASAYFRS